MSLYTITFSDSSDEEEYMPSHVYIPPHKPTVISPTTSSNRAPRRPIPHKPVFDDCSEVEACQRPQITKERKPSNNSLPKETVIAPRNENIKPSEPARINYSISREDKMTLRGHRIHFQFLNNNTAVYHTKLKSIRTDQFVYISNGTDCHFSQEEKYAGVLLINQERDTFSLRSRSKYGPEIMSIMFSSTGKNIPRTIKIHFFCDHNVPQSLRSKKPEQNSLGFWVLDFNNRTTCSSMKNAIMLDRNGKEHIAIMKQRNAALNIDALSNIPDICVFALGIASFICHI